MPGDVIARSAPFDPYSGTLSRCGMDGDFAKPIDINDLLRPTEQ